MAEEKIVLKDKELDMVVGGESWICERTGIGTAAERIGMTYVSAADKGSIVTSKVHYFGLEDAKAFMKEHSRDTFLNADGKPFTL